MKLSIITINLNNREGLQKTYNSVISQIYRDFEYIIIDGQSTDGSVDLIKKNEKEINYWISEKDNGVYSALNKGIKKAVGEYILFLNSGDFLLNNTVLNDIFSKNFTEDILYGDIVYFDPEIQKQLTTTLPRELDLYFFYKQSIWHQASFIKRSLFNSFGFYNEDNNFVSDWLFFMNAIVFSNATYRNVQRVLTNYDMFSGISLKKRDLSDHEKKKILHEKLDKHTLNVLETLDKEKEKYRLLSNQPAYKIFLKMNKHPGFWAFNIFLLKLSQLFKINRSK